MNDGILRRLPRFVKDINLIQPAYDLSDRIWRFPMRFGAGPNDWTMLHVTHYEKTYYCHWTAWDLSLELSLKGKVKKPVYWSLEDKDSKKFELMLTKFTTVYDCAHLHEFSRKNRILPFISWKPIDPMRPRIV